MVGQKQRIIKRFEREAKKKLKGNNLSDFYTNAMMFSLKEVKEIIGKPDEEDKMEEKYFICEHCGELITWSQILSECENGGQGLCGCDFTTPFWSEKYNCIDIDTLRIYYDYTEISKDLFNRLKSERNDVLRLRAFNCVPKDKLKTYEESV